MDFNNLLTVVIPPALWIAFGVLVYFSGPRRKKVDFGWLAKYEAELRRKWYGTKN